MTTDVSRPFFHPCHRTQVVHDEVSLTQGRRSQTLIIDSRARHYENRTFPSRPAYLSEQRNRVSFFRAIMETFLRLGILALRCGIPVRSCAFSTRFFSLVLFSRKVNAYFSNGWDEKDDVCGDLWQCCCRIVVKIIARAKSSILRWRILNSWRTI